MKKIILMVSVLVGLASMGFAQSKDNVARECVLFELFTGVNCPYCPAAANGVAQLLDEGKAIAPVAYHTSSFSTALYYTSETNARASYYSISSYPTLKADGITGMSGGGNASQTNYNQYLGYYNQRISITSPFTIDLSYEPLEDGDCQVTCTVTQVGECSGTNVRVFIALTQCNIDATWQGMTGLHHVCRDLIPNQNGTVFNGPTMTITETFEMNWPKEDCYLTAWVQNYTAPKEVYQAVRMSTALNLDYDLALTGVDDVVTSVCSELQTATLNVKNCGTQTITSFDLCAFDGQEEHRQSWQGELAPGETTLVQMEEFATASCDELQFYLELPNGNPDGFMADNYKSVSVSHDVSTIDGYVKMQLKTDNNPEETTVQVRDMTTGQVVREFTFDQPKHVYEEAFVLEGVGCYRISILDSAGNGLGNGSIFRFVDSEGHLMLSGTGATHFDYSIAFDIDCDGTYAATDEHTEATVVVSPNPSDGTFQLDLGEGLWQVDVFDLSGRMVYHAGDFTSGKVALEGCPSGVYFLKANDGTVEVVRKLMVY